MRDFLKNWSHKVETPDGLRQAGALPYAVVEGRMAFLLITSRRTGRWIFPKGMIEPDMTAWESAALEAAEEAGVTGDISQEPIGSYRASVGLDGGTPVDAQLYPHQFTPQLEESREKDQNRPHQATRHE